MVPLLFVAFGAYNSASRTIGQQVETAVVDNLTVTSRLIDSRMETFFTMCSFIAENQEIQEILAKESYNTYAEKFADSYRVKSILNSLQSTMKMGVPIYITGVNPYARFSTSDLFSLIYYNLRENIYTLLQESGQDVLTYTHLRVEGEDGERVTTTMISKIYKKNSTKLLGYVIVDIYENYFEQELSHNTPYLGDNTFLIDRDGMIVTDKVYKRYTGYPFFPQLLPKLQGESGKVSHKENGVEYIVYYQALQSSGFKLVQMIPEQTIYSSKRSITYFVAIVIAGLLPMVIAMALYLSKRISTPLDELSSLMKRAEGGEMSVKFDLSCDDEIGQIGHSFNAMMAQINHLIEEIHVKQYLLQEAQLSNLKQQMNPHFLYNTLESIKWMARLENLDGINTAVIALGSILRYSLSANTDMVTIKEELEQVNSYLTIQRLRHGKRFEMSMEVDDSLYSCTIPKFMIQPLVENAIAHGLEPKRGNGRLIVSGCHKEGNICLLVRDDGVGLDFPGQKGQGIGLTNVKERIRLYYGNPYGVSLHREGDWTVAELLIPNVTGKEEDDG